MHMCTKRMRCVYAFRTVCDFLGWSLVDISRRVTQPAIAENGTTRLWSNIQYISSSQAARWAAALHQPKSVSIFCKWYN